jgi:putative ABC transport system permease protein
MNLFKKLFQRPAIKREIDEELRFHLEQRTAENLATGMTPEEAAREARKRFGNVQSVREECRDNLGANLGEATWKDIRFGARMLRRNPGFTIIAVLTLALGIGATSAVLTLIQGVLVTPPPYPEADRVMLLRAISPENPSLLRPPTTEEWGGWQRESTTFQSVAGYDWTLDYLIMQDGGEAVSGLEVTQDYFDVIGIKPVLGRMFLASELPKNPQQAACIILSDGLWQRRFHADPDILGKKIRLSRHQPLTVVGVMPSGVRFLPSFGEEQNPTYDVNARVDYWLPAAPNLSNPKGGSGNGPWSVAGRLLPGVTRAQAQTQLQAIASRQAAADEYYKGITAKVQPLVEFLNHEGRRLLLPLLGAVALVFLIACGNVAGLLLARGLRRQQEFAVRCALGARRAALFRQVLAESMILALLGSALGMALAIAVVQAIKAIGAFAIPRLDAVTIGWPMLVFCSICAFIAALLAGLLPAIRATRSDPAAAIKNSGSTSSAARPERRLLSGLAILQTALTLALLVGAGLLVRTMANLTRERPGYETRHILTMSVMTDFEQPTQHDFHERALERISALPGVEKAAFVLGLPLSGTRWVNDEIKIEGQPDQMQLTAKSPVAIFSVTPDYFGAVGMSLLEGRCLQADDNNVGWKNGFEPAAGEKPCVCIINQVMADRFFPNVNPIGQKLVSWPWPKRPKEIIGVVANARTQALTENPQPEVYLSFWQAFVFDKHLIVRTKSDPLLLAATIRRELLKLDPTVAIDHVEPMEQIRDESVATQSFAMRLLVAFSIVGSVLALVGIYGVLSLSVSSRKREIAIRMAVGAQRRNVLGLVLAEGLRLIAIGLVLGTGMALALGRVLRTFLFGVEPADPITFLLVVFLFTAVALLACFIPARRATRIDPMNALRHE